MWKLPHILLSVPIFVAVGGFIFIIHHLSNYVVLCLCLCLGHCFLPLSVCFAVTQELEGGLGENDFRAAEPESGASGGAGSSGKEREPGAGGWVQGGLSDQCQIHEVRVHCMMTLNSGPNNCGLLKIWPFQFYYELCVSNINNTQGTVMEEGCRVKKKGVRLHKGSLHTSS